MLQPQFLHRLLHPRLGTVRPPALHAHTKVIQHFLLQALVDQFHPVVRPAYRPSGDGRAAAGRRRLSTRRPAGQAAPGPILRPLYKLGNGDTSTVFVMAAVTAVAIKLTRIAWRILTDQRDYRPQGRPTQS